MHMEGTPTHKEAILMYTMCFNRWCGAAATANCHMPSLLYSLRVVLCACRMHVCGLLLTWSHDRHMTPTPRCWKYQPAGNHHPVGRSQWQKPLQCSGVGDNRTAGLPEELIETMSTKKEQFQVCVCVYMYIMLPVKIVCGLRLLVLPLAEGC